MLRISKLTDYAIVLATRMAELEGPMSCRALAERSGLPKPTVAKVLKCLGRAGIVDATRGVCGGYALARTPETISVGEIIAAIDGPIAVTECTDDRPDTGCAHETDCELRANWQRINDALGAALEGISLAEMGAANVGGALIQLRRG